MKSSDFNGFVQMRNEDITVWEMPIKLDQKWGWQMDLLQAKKTSLSARAKFPIFAIIFLISLFRILEDFIPIGIFPT